MSLWKLNTPPVLYPNAVATTKGWCDPVTGEVLVCIRQLAKRAGTSTLLSVKLVGSKLAFKAGDVFSVKAKFSEAVVVAGGPPTMSLSINGTPKTLTYASGSGTDTLVFSYTVQAALNAAAGQVTMTSPIALAGGTIVDADAAADGLGSPNVPLTFTPPALTSVAVDTTAPTVTGLAGITGAYVTGAKVSATLTASEPVIVTGAPSIPLTIGAGGPLPLVYKSGSGTASLVFEGTVTTGQAATAGQVVLPGSVALNGGSITDVALNAATLTISGALLSVAAVTIN